MMRIHHLNCVSSCPLGGALMDGRSRSVRGQLVCHCLLIEAPDRLILADTGFGLNDVARPRTRLSPFFLALTSPEFREEMTAVRQVQALGYEADDVRDIVLTHLDFDHAGGLDDFPRAKIHMLEAECESAEAQRSWLDRARYRPQQWSSRSRWITYDARGGGWFGFGDVCELNGLPPDILLVPLAGHTLGHCAIAVEQGDDWLLHAGDAYFYHAEMDTQRPHCTRGLRFYQWMMEKDRGARLANQAKLRELKMRSAQRIRVFCGHDVREFERLSGRAAGQPISREPRGESRRVRHAARKL